MIKKRHELALELYALKIACLVLKGNKIIMFTQHRCSTFYTYTNIISFNFICKNEFYSRKLKFPIKLLKFDI